MFRSTRMILAVLVAIVGFGAPAMAHDWGCWVQPNRTVYVYNTANYWSEANAALNEWDADTILSVPRTSSHTEVSVFDGAYGNTGWGGLAEVISASGCNITHCHARLNYSYSYTSNGKRGIFCQEFGHCLGLDHSNDGGCMGGGYFYSINSYYTVVSHNINDIYNKYRYKHADGGEHTDSGEETRIIHALWHDKPSNLFEARDMSDAIVVVEVASVDRSEDIVIPVKGIENDEDRIPTEWIGLSVRKVLHGDVASFVNLFHTGSADFVISGDPQYKVGESYVLFLKAREDGTYRVLSPEGRYKLNADGLEPVSEASFAMNLKGFSVRDLSRDLNEHRMIELQK